MVADGMSVAVILDDFLDLEAGDIAEAVNYMRPPSAQRTP